MRFANPQMLWLLIIPPIYLVWSFFDQRRRQKRLSTLVQSGLWSKVFIGLIPAARVNRGYLFSLALVFGVLSLARPQWGTIEETVKISGLDIMTVLDVSNSMLVEDMVPNRLKKAKHIMRNVVGSVAGDRVGLVLFAGSSYLACPLTTDTDYVIENIEQAEPDLIQNQGTNFGSALETATKALEAGAQEGKPGSRVIVLITDGEDHEGAAKEYASVLKEKGIVLYIVGVGTEAGGPIPIRESSGRTVGYKREGRDAIVSRFDSKTLVEVAETAGGIYWKASEAETEVDEISTKLKSLARGDLQEKKIVQYKDRYQLPLFFMVILLFYELFIPIRRITKPLTVMLLFGWFGVNSAQAASSSDAYFENQKGLKAFQNKQGDQALEHFKKAGEKSPDQAEFLFNQGVANLQRQDAEGAIKAFSESKEKALKSGRKDLAARSSFNEAIAQAPTEKNDEAIRSYLSAADLARQSNDEELLKDAKKNLELLNQKIEQKKQEQQSKDDQKKDEKKDENKDQKKDDKDQNKDQKQQNEKGDEKNNEKQNGEKDKDQNGKDKSDKAENDSEDESKPGDQGKQQKKQFRSLKLSQEDADRVMAELANREKQLQTKLRKQKAPQGRSSKDW